jgi:hypothetical protein
MKKKRSNSDNKVINGLCVGYIVEDENKKLGRFINLLQTRKNTNR